MPWGVRLVCFWVPGLLLFLSALWGLPTSQGIADGLSAIILKVEASGFATAHLNAMLLIPTSSMFRNRCFSFFFHERVMQKIEEEAEEAEGDDGDDDDDEGDSDSDEWRTPETKVDIG